MDEQAELSGQALPGLRLPCGHCGHTIGDHSRIRFWCFECEGDCLELAKAKREAN